MSNPSAQIEIRHDDSIWLLKTGVIWQHRPPRMEPGMVHILGKYRDLFPVVTDWVEMDCDITVNVGIRLKPKDVAEFLSAGHDVVFVEPPKPAPVRRAPPMWVGTSPVRFTRDLE